MNNMRGLMSLLRESAEPEGIDDGLADWFQDSKVVDKQGNPLLVHHGTNIVFDRFDAASAPVNRLVPGKEHLDPNGAYFTPDAPTAYAYGASAVRKSGLGRARVMNCYLRMTNPLDITAAVKYGQKKGLTFGEAKRRALSKLDTSVHDGVIFQGNAHNRPEYIVFHPDQVRLAKKGTPS